MTVMISTAHAASEKEIQVIINDKAIVFDVPPVREGERISQAFGNKMEIPFYGANRL